MVSQFSDSFKRADVSLADASETNYQVICGSAAILDNSVVPISVDGSAGFGVGNDSPTDLLTVRRTQVFYTQPLDRQDIHVSAWIGHDEDIPAGTSGNAAFTLLVRSTKDPELLDLGGTEEPDCYDQGYGLRFTAETNATAAKLAIVKLLPSERVNSSRADSDQPDDAVVLVEVQLQSGWMNNNPDLTIPTDPKSTTDLAFRGMFQHIRLRISGSDGDTKLEAYLNDRWKNNPIMAYTDRADPTWDTGQVGFEFWSPEDTDQPSGASPFFEAAAAVMRCAKFAFETIRTFAEPRREFSPQTYGQVTDRVITLVEKNGEEQFAATASGQARRLTYLDFVLEAEAHIIRKEGYWDWLYRREKIFLVNGQDSYELPADFGEMEMLRPGTWNSGPLEFSTQNLFFQRLGGLTRTGGLPRIYTYDESGGNRRPKVRIFPVPTINDLENDNDQTVNPDAEDTHMVVEYYRRRMRPTSDTIDDAVPVMPQQHIDVLVYGACVHALMLDADHPSTQMFAQTFNSKLMDLRRSNNRSTNERAVLRSAADVFPPSQTNRIPLLRASQLEVLLI